MPSGIFSKRPQRAIVVELFGLPGSGKTFLTQALFQMLREKDRSVLDFSRGTSPSRLTWSWAVDHLARQAWILRHPLVTRSLRQHVNMTGQTNPEECKRFVKGWLKTVVRLQRVMCSYDIILMDQGFLQTLWAIGYQAESSTWPELRRHLLGLMPVPDSVILVETSRDTATRRLTERPGITSRVERDGPGSPAVMQHASQLTDALRHDLTALRDDWRQTAFYPINNDTDAPPTAALASIAERLLRQTSNSPPPASLPAALKRSPSPQSPAQSTEP